MKKQAREKAQRERGREQKKKREPRKKEQEARERKRERKKENKGPESRTQWQCTTPPIFTFMHSMECKKNFKGFDKMTKNTSLLIISTHSEYTYRNESDKQVRTGLCLVIWHKKVQ